MRLLVQCRLLAGHQIVRVEPGPLQKPVRRTSQEPSTIWRLPGRTATP